MHLIVHQFKTKVTVATLLSAFTPLVKWSRLCINTCYILHMADWRSCQQTLEKCCSILNGYPRLFCAFCVVLQQCPGDANDALVTICIALNVTLAAAVLVGQGENCYFVLAACGAEQTGFQLKKSIIGAVSVSIQNVSQYKMILVQASLYILG